MSLTVDYTTPTLSISPIRISTMVTTCHVGTIINLDRLFEEIPILDYWDLTDGVLKMEYQRKVKGTAWKDILQKPDAKEKTFFFNQATLVIRQETAPLHWKEINVKLFRNGGVQMTGVRSESMCQNAIDWLVSYIKAHCPSKVFEDETRIHKMQIQLVNTDFSIGARIKRDALYKILSEKFHLTVSYEPSIYQGVKTKYFYNAQKPASCPPGLCPCEKLCKGAADGDRLGHCKKITISPFQTGQIIITGARTMDQIQEAYDFMIRLFETYADEVIRKNYICPEGTPEVPEKTGKTKTGWIHHPSPRNVFKISKAKITEPICG